MTRPEGMQTALSHALTGDGFHWHEAARLFGPDGAEIVRPATFDPCPSGQGAGALASVLAGQGRPFRIGGTGALEAGLGEFETLTGGSLGLPRRVVRSQSSWVASFAINAQLFGLEPGQRVAVLGSFVHSLALYAACEGLCCGADVHVLEGLRPDRQAIALAENGVQVLYATPSQLRLILSSRPSLPHLRHVVIGGAKLDEALSRDITRLAPNASIHEFYGAAETSFITIATRGGKGNRTVGFPYPGVALRIDPVTGLIWVKSPYLFRGYAGDDPGSARWDGDWLSVGEIGQMTDAGLVLNGRAGRMVTVADRNVFPEEIETFLLSLPGVERAAVLPVGDGQRGHVLVAQLLGDRQQETAILSALRRELGALVAPKRLDWHTDWPVLASGKTDLAALAASVRPWR